MTVLHTIKQHYWRLANRWDKWRRPRQVCLSPEPWMSAVKRQMPVASGADGRQAPFIYVDGGAHDGQMARRFRHELPNLTVYAFEPNADLLPKLRENLRGVPGAVYGQALGAEVGPAQFHVNSSPMTSSLLPVAELSRRYFADATQPRETRQVQVTTLDEWSRQTGVERIDILKLDLQGYEAPALAGGRALLTRSQALVVLEVNFVPFYEGCSLFVDVERELRACGYQLYNLYNICTHLPGGHIGSCDAIFLPQHQVTAMGRRAA